MQRNRVIIWGTLLMTLVASVSALMLPIPPLWPASSVEFYQQLIVSIVMAFFHTGSAILFITNLDVYTAKLRRAYITLAIGTIISGAATLQISLITVLDGWRTPYAQSGATMLPFVLSGIILYLGTRHFARLFGIKNFLTRAWIAIPVALGVALLSTQLPYIPGDIPDLTMDVLVGISVWSGSLMLLAGLVTLYVRQQAGAHYTAAMTWLSWALFVGATAVFYTALYGYLNVDNTTLLDSISNVLTCTSGVLWVRAGYAFALTKYYNEDIPMIRFLLTQSEPGSANRPKTVVDMVTYAAGLVSNSRDIDPMLDKVRSITAKLKPGEAPSKTDSQSLLATYLKIEHYLTTKEAMRHYTQKELRSQFDPNLEKMIMSHEK